MNEILIFHFSGVLNDKIIIIPTMPGMIKTKSFIYLYYTDFYNIYKTIKKKYIHRYFKNVEVFFGIGYI